MSRITKSTLPRSHRSAESPFTIPNLLSLSRLPLAIGLFASIAEEAWWLSLGIFLLAAATDWLDGWWARRFNLQSLLGRNLDPLTDKVLVCGAFIYLLPVPTANLSPWMVTLVVCREVFVTGLRGIVEAQGLQFGADAFGKLKMFLQCIWLIVVLLLLSLSTTNPEWITSWMRDGQQVILWSMLAATLGSGLQYSWKATRAMNSRWHVSVSIITNSNNESANSL